MFEEFDPLQISDSAQIDESHIRERQKRNIHSILHSYVSWYDPFSELVQNALDSVDKRARNANKEYLRQWCWIRKRSIFAIFGTECIVQRQSRSR